MRLNFAIAFLFFSLITSCTIQYTDENTTVPKGNDENNLLFDNEDTKLLKGTESIKIFGEVEEEQDIILSEHTMRSVVVKEVGLENGKRVFKGTYRYDGYSLEDILANVRLDKKSGFNPITDLFVKVYGSDGSHTIISWAEIFYPVHHNMQIIATRAARHIPFKTPDARYPLPDQTKLVISNDLITCRNIPAPVSIEICSSHGDFPEENPDPLYWPTLSMEGFTDEPVVIEKLPEELPLRESDMIFYGRGRGIHDVNPFDGYYLSDLLGLYLSPDEEMLRTGYVVASAPDGYRSVFSLSEIMNRNDRLETLITDKNNYEKAGKFSIIVTGDFFSDRAMKAMWKIVLLK